MFSHSQVWAAIDRLARHNQISVSRLARNAGLDPTTFNKSKRAGSDGRLRWPSTESLAKIMEATHTSTDMFLSLMQEQEGGSASRVSDLNPIDAFSADTSATFTVPAAVPLLGLAQAGTGGFFDDAGFPAGQGWDQVEFPKPDGETIYALEISGDSMKPLYRDGDRIIVSPGTSIRRGDRVVVRTNDGEVLAKVLLRKTASQIELESLNPDHPNLTYDLKDVDWMARIVWASQ